MLRQGGWEKRQAADWLEGRQNLEDPQTVCALAFEPDQKAILLTALAWKYPQHRDILLTTADRLNYERKFPYYLLKSIYQENNQKQKNT